MVQMASCKVLTILEELECLFPCFFYLYPPLEIHNLPIGINRNPICITDDRTSTGKFLSVRIADAHTSTRNFRFHGTHPGVQVIITVASDLVVVVTMLVFLCVVVTTHAYVVYVCLETCAVVSEVILSVDQ